MFALRRALAGQIAGRQALARLAAPASRSFATHDALKPDIKAGTPEEFRTCDGLLESNRLDNVGGDGTNRAFHYAVLGTNKFMYAAVGRIAVVNLVTTMSASADVLALSSVEVDISQIDEGTGITVKWRGKPIFIKHRTAQEIATAQADDNASLRDPQTDAERVQDPKWLVLIGVCTHLGCVPAQNAGAFNAWFCPCHGSHYDLSGRIRLGPAPLNLEVPSYKFTEPTRLLIG